MKRRRRFSTAVVFKFNLRVESFTDSATVAYGAEDRTKKSFGVSSSMEGIGSRLGRVSSRYGPAATVFNGPVRKWKKKWVLASSSSSGLNYQTSSHSQSNAQKLLLCRWTPIHPPTSSEADEATAPPDEPPKRKFRYTPVSSNLYLNPFCISNLCSVCGQRVIPIAIAFVACELWSVAGVLSEGFLKFFLNLVYG